jgi:hypothetical protein
MGMAAPKGMALAAPQAGLAAIAKPATAPKGMSSGNMAQVMARAKDMSDSQLADVLQGKSLDVPQYVAMTEAMGRKSLRTAMQGQQAMAQAQQPSVKQKLLMGDQPQMQGIQQGMPMPQQPVMAAEGGLMYADGGPIDMNMSANAGGGIAELPAPNMMPMTMAGGGIVAFDEGGEVPRFNEGVALTADEMQQLLTRGSIRRSDEDIKKALEEQTNFGMSPRTRAARKGDEVATAKANAMTPAQLDALATNKGVFPEGSPALPGTGAAVSPDVTMPARKAAGPALTTPGAGPDRTGLGATDEFGSYMDMVKKNNADYLSKLEGLGAKQREGLAKLRSEGGGEALMNLAGALFSNPNMAMALGKGLPAVAQTAAASRKEQRAIEQSANEYDLNLAKAQEAAAKGDMDAALNFKKLAQDAKYQQGMLQYHMAALGKPGESMQLLNAIRKPGESLSDAYARMQTLKKPIDVIPRATALKEWGDLMPNEQRRYGTFENYYNTVNSTGGGGGNDLQAQASAELARRSKS